MCDGENLKIAFVYVKNLAEGFIDGVLIPVRGSVFPG